MKKEEWKAQVGDLLAHNAPQVLRPYRERVFTGVVTLGAEAYPVLGISYLNDPVGHYRRVVIVVPDCRCDVVDDNVAFLNFGRLFRLDKYHAAGVQLRLHAGAENRHKGHYASHRHKADDSQGAYGDKRQRTLCIPAFNYIC